VGKKDFDADAHEDNASKEFRLEAAGDGGSKVATQVEAEDGEEERYEADNREWLHKLGEVIIASAGKRDAYSQGVDAGGNSQE
jgi:hypothetical protein